MLFGTQQHLSKWEGGGLKLNINEESLEQVSCFKYLGHWLILYKLETTCTLH